MTKGERIKAMREAHNMSQVELASKIPVSKQNLYKYENNIITNIPSDKIEAIANVFGTTPAYLMGWTDSPEIPSTTINRTLRPDESNLLDDYNVLSDIGKNKVTTYTKNLRDVEEAEAFVNAAHERNDIDATEEMFQSDEDIMNDENF